MVTVDFINSDLPSLRIQPYATQILDFSSSSIESLEMKISGDGVNKTNMLLFACPGTDYGLVHDYNTYETNSSMSVAYPIEGNIDLADYLLSKFDAPYDWYAMDLLTGDMIRITVNNKDNLDDEILVQLIDSTGETVSSSTGNVSSPASLISNSTLPTVLIIPKKRVRSFAAYAGRINV